MLDDAFQALQQYDWGTDFTPIAPIDQAVAESHGNAAACEDLEKRLLAALRSKLSRDAKDYVCRKLAIVGSAASVPTLAALLPEANHSHMARFALERIPAAEAGQALREAVAKTSGELKIGVLSSIGARRDSAAVAMLGALLRDNDGAVARAAAIALGDIGNAEAVSVLQASVSSDSSNNRVVNDALLSCAEALLAGNQLNDALSIYKRLAGDHQNRLVKLAATRGMLACMGKQA